MNLSLYAIGTYILLLSSISFLAKAGDGKFSIVRGKVFYQGEGAAEKKARRRMKVEPGAKVRTEPSSYAKITMSDGNIFHVGPDSEFTIDRYDTDDGDAEGNKASILSVVYGKVRSSLEQKYDGKGNRFRVKTQAALVGVRGTDFLTEHSDVTGLTRVTAFEGLVAVNGFSDDGKILGEKQLGPGQMLLVTPGEAPYQPVELPSEVIQEIQSGSQGKKGKFSLKKEATKKISNAEAMGPSRLEFGRESLARPGHDHRRGVDREFKKAAGQEGNKSVTIDFQDNT